MPGMSKLSALKQVTDPDLQQQATVKPAEFLIFRIGQKIADAEAATALPGLNKVGNVTLKRGTIDAASEMGLIDGGVTPETVGGAQASSDPEWKYTPVRRVADFLEESLHEGSSWPVFEPDTGRTDDGMQLATADWHHAAAVAPLQQGRVFTDSDLNEQARLPDGARNWTDHNDSDPGVTHGSADWRGLPDLQFADRDGFVFDLEGGEAGRVTFGDGAHGHVPPTGADDDGGAVGRYIYGAPDDIDTSGAFQPVFDIDWWL